MEDTFSHQVLTDKLNSGTLKVIVYTPLRTITTTIGFLKLDSSQLQRIQLEDYSLHQLDGTDILKSGTTKLSTLKIHSRLMMETLMLLLFHQEETILLLEEKTKKLEFMISVMLKSQPQFTMLELQSTVLLSTQEAHGLPLELKTDGKFGTLKLKTMLSLLMANTD